jgi:polysaccharide export outer membrane protein
MTPFCRKTVLAAASVALLTLASCQSGGSNSLSRCLRSGEPILPASKTFQASTAAGYSVGTGDRVRVTVFGEADLSGEFEVDGSGSISMPLIGQFAATGLTTVQLEKKIADLLRGDFILNPRVSAEVINYRPFYIQGEVNKPDQYPFSSNLSVLKAVATAGGFSYRANKSVVKIQHLNAKDEVAYELTNQTMVQPGDSLRICERIF